MRPDPAETASQMGRTTEHVRVGSELTLGGVASS
jgi:hypothetical protein